MNADYNAVHNWGSVCGSFMLDPAISNHDEQACRVWRLTPDALAGKTLLDLAPAVQPDGTASEAILARRLEAAGNGLSQCFEWRVLRGDGRTADTLLHLEGIAGSEPVRFRARIRELSELNQAQAALRESEMRLEQILENTTAVVYVKDTKGRYLLANRQFQRLFRLREPDVVGRIDNDLFPREVAEILRANDLRVLDELAALEFEEVVASDDGNHTYLSQKFPLFNTAGEAYAVCGISTDITERKRTEQGLRNVALGVSAARGDDVFQAIVYYLAASLDVEFAFVGKLIESGTPRIQTLAICHHERIVENMEYDLSDTPCESVVGRQFQFIPARIRTLYPGDNMLKHYGFESYAGYPLFDVGGRSIGLIAVADPHPLTDRALSESMLKIFSVRAAAELERMEAEEALRNSEASYRAIFEASEDAIFVHDMDTGAIVDVNPHACRAYGYEYHELLKATIGDLSSGVHPYTMAEGVKLVQQAKSGIPQRLEWHRRNKDGSLHWDEVLLMRATIAGTDRILGFTREITERKEREEALRKSEDRLRATVETALDPIIGMDAEGRIVEFNPAAERCFGYQRKDVIGKPLADLMIPPGERAAHQAGLQHYRDSGRGPFLGRRVELTAMRSDGSAFPAELAISVAQGPEGEIFIGYLRDITERKSAEQERLALEAQLRQAQKMEAIGHLSGGVAHDFNNILTGILGYVSLSREQRTVRDDPKLSRYLEHAARSGERARDLIAQLLTFSRGQKGEPRPVVLAPLLTEAVKLLSSTLPATIEVECDFDSDAPAVLIDPVQVEQVLMNLGINARDAMEGIGRLQLELKQAAHEGAVCASCRQAVSGKFVELTVRDTGAGIPPAHLDRIFEPFFSTKEVGRGSGMGLSTVHGIVHEYGAHILLDTASGRGTVFRILFHPLESSQMPTDSALASSTPEAAYRLDGHALVVDDDESAGEYTKDLLESWGLEVTLTTNGTQALDVFARAPDRYRFALLDQTMPGMTGITLAGQLLNQRADLPLVLYTGYSEHISEAKAKSAGFHALIRKPVDPNQLFELLLNLDSATP